MSQIVRDFRNGDFEIVDAVGLEKVLDVFRAGELRSGKSGMRRFG